MREPLLILIVKPVEVALNYLYRVGELGDSVAASKILIYSIPKMIQKGERRRKEERRELMPFNEAIIEYREAAPEVA